MCDLDICVKLSFSGPVFLPLMPHLKITFHNEHLKVFGSLLISLLSKSDQKIITCLRCVCVNNLAGVGTWSA